MNAEPKLRSKRELIEQFLKTALPNIEQSGDVEAEFYSFWNEQKRAKFDELCTEAGLDKTQAEQIIATYLMRGEKPRDHEIAESLIQKPSILERDGLLSRVKELLNNFLSVFVDSM